MVTYRELADQAAELIFLACQPEKPEPGVVKAILDPYTPTGSSRFVSFSTSKPLYTTDPTPRSKRISGCGCSIAPAAR
jgi:type III restriction enzyme